MKVHNNSAYMGDDVRSARHGEGDKIGNDNRNTVDGSALKSRFDPIAAKKKKPGKRL